jgi:hypothetical protein
VGLKNRQKRRFPSPTRRATRKIAGFIGMSPKEWGRISTAC